MNVCRYAHLCSCDYSVIMIATYYAELLWNPPSTQHRRFSFCSVTSTDRTRLRNPVVVPEIPNLVSSNDHYLLSCRQCVFCHGSIYIFTYQIDSGWLGIAGGLWLFRQKKPLITSRLKAIGVILVNRRPLKESEKCHMLISQNEILY